MQENFEKICACLPPRVRTSLLRMREGQADFLFRLSEVRLRTGHNAALTYDGQALLLPVVCTGEEVNETLRALCNGSVYAHKENLRCGFLTAFGCRVGVAGRAVFEGRQVGGIAEISSLCIRLPHPVPGAGGVALSVFRHYGGQRGVLIFSPPGGGKTTMLREFARTVSVGQDARRVVLIDSRAELYDSTYPPACQVDVLRGYPPAMAIEMATRSLSPQIVLCDEIGSMEEAEALCRVMGCGIPLLASAHAGSVKELLARPPIRLLSGQGAFAAYIGIVRQGNVFSYHVYGEDGMPFPEKEESFLCYS